MGLFRRSSPEDRAADAARAAKKSRALELYFDGLVSLQAELNGGDIFGKELADPFELFEDSEALGHGPAITALGICHFKLEHSWTDAYSCWSRAVASGHFPAEMLVKVQLSEPETLEYLVDSLLEVELARLKRVDPDRLYFLMALAREFDRMDYVASMRQKMDALGIR